MPNADQTNVRTLWHVTPRIHNPQSYTTNPSSSSSNPSTTSSEDEGYAADSDNSSPASLGPPAPLYTTNAPPYTPPIPLLVGTPPPPDVTVEDCTESWWRGEAVQRARVAGLTRMMFAFALDEGTAKLVGAVFARRLADLLTIPTSSVSNLHHLQGVFVGVLRTHLDTATTKGSYFLPAARAAFVVIQAMEERAVLAASRATSPSLTVPWVPVMEVRPEPAPEDEGASQTEDNDTGAQPTLLAGVVADVKAIAVASLCAYVTMQGVELHNSLVLDWQQALAHMATIQETMKSSMPTPVAKVLCEAVYVSFAAQLMGSVARNRRLSEQDISALVPTGVVAEWGRQARAINDGTPPLWSSMMTFMRWYTGNWAGSSGIASRLEAQCEQIATSGGGNNENVAAKLHEAIGGAPWDRRYRIDTLYPATLASAQWNDCTDLAVLDGAGVKYRVETLLALERMCGV